MSDEENVVKILGGHDEFRDLASDLSQLVPNVPDSDDALEEFIVSTLTAFGLSENHALLEPLQGLYRQVTNRLDLDIRHIGHALPHLVHARRSVIDLSHHLKNDRSLSAMQSPFFSTQQTIFFATTRQS